ncbi:MAG: aldehyde dehydrogenase family protein [Micromonosporaceae bacterium]|nr:aldehyde dehydrogenase family protein [Micromonosporaceae bacterium]
MSTNPVTGDEVARLAAAAPDDVDTAVRRAREAAERWGELGFAERRRRLLAWNAVIARRMRELAHLMHRETGKPVGDGLLEIANTIEHLSWAARNARRVLRARRMRGSLLTPEYGGLLEYQPYGVVGVIGPWNYPAFTPMGSIGYALAAGNAVVFKPSEYSPAVGEWLVTTFAEAVGDAPMFQAVHGLGDVGAALTRSGVDKVAFTGSTATGKRVMAACAESLTPVVIECGGKDAMIVDADADLDAAADAAIWGGMANAGQTCVGIERVYAVDSVYDALLTRLVDRAGKLRVAADEGANVGPITMPGQIDIIRRHIDDAIARGGTAALGGLDAVRPPYVHPTILTDVPEESDAVCQETFGPTLTVTRVADADEAVRRANATPYGLGASIFGRRRALALARKVRSGMAAINSTISFAVLPTLPFGGVGESGFGRIHGDDGLREFARAKAIARRRMPSALPLMSFRRTPRAEKLVTRVMRAMHGRR